MRTITPMIDQNVKKFCNDYINKNELFYVDIIPDKNAKMHNCFYNVDDVIKKYGGSKIYGWVIWKWPNILIEAEAHAIWKREDGKYIDVTPHEKNINKILFVPDMDMVYKGTIIRSKRMPLTNSPDTKRLIQLNEIRENIMLNSEGDTYELPKNLFLELMKLEKQFNTIARRNEPCPCNSGLKYKKCCGKYGV